MGAARNMTLKSATEASFTSASAEPSISHSVTISQSAMRFLSANAFFPSALSGISSPKNPQTVFQKRFCLLPGEVPGAGKTAARQTALFPLV